LAAGALSAGITSAAGPFINGPDRIASVAANAVVGGLASVAGGGKFANGAVTGAFGYLFNELEHQRLSAITIRGGQGDYIWQVQFQLGEASQQVGWIVQETTSSACEGCSTKTFWEAFGPIASGQKVTNDTRYSPDPDESVDDTFTTYGSAHVSTSARFYEGLTKLPDSFTFKNGGTPAGSTFSSVVNPSLPLNNATPPLVRAWHYP
jgi:hypothetical protein